MSKTRIALLALVVPVTAAAYVVGCWITVFLACGISGCSGGGFGTAFDPELAQAALLVQGLLLVPVALLLTSGWRVRLLAAGLAVAAGSLTAVVLTDVGPNGCPLGQAQAVAGPEAWEPGSRTCESDDDALPA